MPSAWLRLHSMSIDVEAILRLLVETRANPPRPLTSVDLKAPAPGTTAAQPEIKFPDFYINLSVTSSTKVYSFKHNCGEIQDRFLPILLEVARLTSQPR